MEKKTWTMNETQTAFIEALKANGGKATLFELNYFKGYAFKSGSVNTLIKKGLVKADDEVTYDCDVIYNGVKVGSVKKTAKVYELVSND
jgi:hypothetical protein